MSLNVNGRKGGLWEENFGMVKKVAKEANIFTDCITKSHLFYLDNILLSASGNKLFIHNIKLPEKTEKGPDAGGQYKLAKCVTMSECKSITSMSCINQFYSFVTLIACSDRSVRVYDVNQAKIVRKINQCHSRSTHTIVQNEGSNLYCHSDRGYDLFITSAVCDGAKLWDIRTQNDMCVQKFDSKVSNRHQVGVSLSPCLQYVATGAEDGHVYVYDTRQRFHEYFSREPCIKIDTSTLG